MASSEMVNVIEQCRIAPPPGSVDGRSLPLTFFDIPWVNFPFMRLLFFYEFSHPKAYFVRIIIPRLKRSLSLALKHFFPFSGKLIFPADGTSIPEIRYEDGDSVSVIFAECSLAFDHLSGNHQRNDADFLPLAVKLPPPSTNYSGVPLLAVQVTLFPESGICIAFTAHHVVGDANAFYRFPKSWASIFKRGGDWDLEKTGILPFFDRTVVKDPICLRSTLWNHFGKMKYVGQTQNSSAPPTSKVRAAFVLRRTDVQGLKKRVLRQVPKGSRVSSFTVICGYVWSCMVKARAGSGDEGGENELEHLAMAADCRALMEPPIPAAYFGNCLMGFIVSTEGMRLIGGDGFIIATKLIADAIQERVVRSKDGMTILEGTRKWVSEMNSINLARMVSVGGFPRLGVYDWDFGFGRSKKGEYLAADEGGNDFFSLNASRENHEDVEVRLRFPKPEMDAFAHIFISGLNPNYSRL